MNQYHNSLIFFQAILLLMLVQISTDIYLPSMQLMASEFNSSIFTIKLSITFMVISLGLSQLIYGPLSDCYGRRKIVIIGLINFILGSSITVFTTNIYLFLIGRIVQGLGLGFGLSAPAIIAGDIYKQKRLQQATSLISIVYAIMPAIAPIIGGALQTYAHWRASLWTLLASSLFMLFTSTIFFHETNKNIQTINGQPTFASIIKTYMVCLSNKFYLGNLFIMAFFYAGEVAYIIQMPLIAQGIFSVAPLLTGWLVIFTSVAIIIGSIVSAYLAGRVQSDVLIYAGISSAVAGAVLWLSFLFMKEYSLVTLVMPMIFFMFGSGLAFPNCIANCLNEFPENSGTALALSTGTLTAMGGGLSFIIAKVPYYIDYALPIFILIMASLMIMCSLLIVRKRVAMINMNVT